MVDSVSRPMLAEWEELDWPAKYDLFGIDVSAATYDDAVESIMTAVARRRPACISALAVHGVVTGMEDDRFGTMLNAFDLIAPDGQPVRIALNALHGTRLPDRVYGPELMLRLCARAAREHVGIYLYGSTTDVVERLIANLRTRFPGLQIVGHEPSLFRPLTADEDAELISRINDSNAGLVFVGLGCPLQERFAYEHRESITAVQICVGAAFDFHAGTKPMAPRWMQRAALEWLYRLLHEPRRLWRRYAHTNRVFTVRLLRELVRGGRS